MGVFTKLKNIFYDEEYIEEPEEDIKIEKPIKREFKREIKKEEVDDTPRVSEIKITGYVDEPVTPKKVEREPVREERAYREEPSYKNERELFKPEKSSFNFTQFDDEELPQRRNVMDYESRTSSYKKEVQKPVEVEQPKVFKPSPVISPIYGILDKDYRKEEIVAKAKEKENVVVASDSATTYDSVRKKAYGTLEDDLEDTLNTMNKLSTNTIKESINDINDAVDAINTKANKIEDYISKVEEQTPEVSIGELEDKVKETIDVSNDTISDNTLEHDLFNLIDSMYDKED